MRALSPRSGRRPSFGRFAQRLRNPSAQELPDRPPTARLGGSENEPPGAAPAAAAEGPRGRPLGASLWGGILPKLARQPAFSSRQKYWARQEPHAAEKSSCSPDDRTHTERSEVSSEPTTVVSEMVSSSDRGEQDLSARLAARQLARAASYDEDLELGNQREMQREGPNKLFLASSLRRRHLGTHEVAASMSPEDASALLGERAASAVSPVGASRDQQRREVVLQVAERSRRRAMLKLQVATAMEAEQRASQAWSLASEAAEAE